MSKFVGFIVGAIEIGIGVATGNPTLIAMGAETILAQAVVDLTAPKAPARDASEMTIALGEQPRVLMVGEAFTPGSLVDGFNYGGKYGTDWEVLVIRLADHKCHSLTGFYVDDEWVPYTGDGNYPQFDSHHFSLWFRSDTSSQALPDVVTDHGPGWTVDDIGRSGCDVIVAYLADKPDAKNPAWPGGRPKFGFVLKGAFCYDPRKDDTVTGGSGAHRYDDPDTWEWSENAVICRYRWARGVYADDDSSDQSKLLVGRGLTAEEAPPENIIAPANVCEEIAAGSYPYFEASGATGMLTGRLSPDGSTLIVVDEFGVGTHVEAWDLRTRSLVAHNDLPATVNGNDIGPITNRSFYATTNPKALWLMNIDGTGDLITNDFDAAFIGGCCYAAGTVFILPAISTSHAYSYYDGSRCPEVSTGFAPSCFFESMEGEPWSVGPVGASSGKIRLRNHATATEYEVTTSFNSDCGAVDNGNGQFFIMQQNGKGFLFDKTTHAITHTSTDSGTNLGGTDLRRQCQAAHPGDGTIWFGYKQWNMVTGELIRTVDPLDWTSTASTRTVYDRWNNAIIAEFSTTLTWRFLDRNGSYRVAGPIYANQEHIDVELMFAAATAGTIITHEGSVELEPGQAKSVVATITDNDLVVGSKVSVNNGFLSEADDGWVNTVVPTYIEPDQKWNSHAAPPLRDTADIASDGKPREQQLTLRLVRYLNQAQRVGEIARRMGRLWWRGHITLGPRFCELEAGDWISWQSDRYFNGATITFRIENSNLDEKWQITLDLREMLASVFADDAVFDPDLAIPSRTPFPPVIGSPDSGDWTLTAVTLDSLGFRTPALEVTGAVPDDESAEAIIFEYWLSDGVTDPTADSDAVTWTQYGGRYPPTTTLVDITGLVGGATYYVAVSYVVSGELGDRLVLGPATLEDYATDPLVLMEDGSTPLLMEDGVTPLSLG